MRPIGSDTVITTKQLHSILDSHMMRHISNLHVLYFPQTPQDLLALANIIKQNKSLAKVNMYMQGGTIGGVGAVAIAEAIKQSTSLTVLSLGGTLAGSDDAVTIANAITQSQSLTDVDLNYNHIGDVGVSAIAGAIKKSTSMSLSRNSISVIGASVIAEAIKQSNSLTGLVL